MVFVFPGVGHVVTLSHPDNFNTSAPEYQHYKSRRLPQQLHGLPKSVFVDQSSQARRHNFEGPKLTLLSNSCRSPPAAATTRTVAFAWADVVIASEGWIMGRALTSKLYLSYPPFTTHTLCAVNDSSSTQNLRPSSLLREDRKQKDERECWVSPVSTEEEGPPHVVLPCHPAKFSIGFGDGVTTTATGGLALAEPFDACAANATLQNHHTLGGKIVVVRRGGCTFRQKAEAIAAIPENGRPAAVLVIDTPSQPSKNSAGNYGAWYYSGFSLSSFNIRYSVFDRWFYSHGWLLWQIQNTLRVATIQCFGLANGQ